jgi:hypothetical protein
MSDSTDDLEPLVADLAETLSALERRIDEEPSRRRAFLRFTEEYAIPTTVAVLEANIRLLEAVGGAIRIAEGRESERRGTGSRDAALSALDRTLSEVTDAVRGTPTDPDARRLLEEARDLRAEIDDRVAGRRRDDRSTSSPSPSPTGGGTAIPVSDAGDATDEDDGSAVDVDAELDTIRREVHGDDEDDAA